MTKYGKLTLGLIAGWFVFALSASALHLFENNFNRVGIAVALAAVVPIAIFAVWVAASTEMRRFVMSLNPQTLTAVQSWRILGLVFVILQARNLLPGMFALPAGYGDIAIGATASLVAWQLTNSRHRGSFILWQILGIADLIVAVGVGTTAGFINPQGPSMAPMTVLPLSLIPTFLVPLFMILHFICIAQARAWKSVGGGVRQPAAVHEF